MKVKLLVLAAALLMLCSLSFAQNFVACIFDDGYQLRDACTNGAPLPDGTVGVIYYDADSNGPSANDLPATVCDNPPDCPSGPPGTVNFNTFHINAGDWGLDAGEFLMDPCFTSSGLTPSPARYYIVITAANGLKWTSPVMTMSVGPQDIDLTTGWTCVPGITCTAIPASGEVDFALTGPVNGPQTGEACIALCTDHPTVLVKVGPLGGHHDVAMGRYPHVVATDGCPTGCPAGNGPASGYTFNGDFTGPWVLVGSDATGWYYQQPITMGTVEGCVHLSFDFILPVAVTNVVVAPLENSVKISFSARSANDLASYEISRDGHAITSIDANTSATSRDYSYVDNSALNGHTYTYEVATIGLNGSRTVIASQAATPSMENAVVTEYALHQNFPNPFNPTTSIRFDLVDKNFVTLKIYNANGQVVATVVNGERNKGVNIVNFDASSLTSGLYFYTVKVGNLYSATKKMLLVK